MYEEKRRYPRLDINVDIEWKKISAAATDAVIKGVSKNISEGGICLLVYEKLNTGDILSLDIKLPSGKMIRSRGKVAWIKEFEIIGQKIEKGYDAGIELVDVNEEDKKVLKEFVFRFLK